MRGTEISDSVRRKVYIRDSFDGWPCCIFCGSPYEIEVAHYVSRARGGKGVPENLACLCHRCHAALDNGSDIEKANRIKDYFKYYLETMYPGWDEKSVTLGGKK